MLQGRTTCGPGTIGHARPGWEMVVEDFQRERSAVRASSHNVSLYQTPYNSVSTPPLMAPPILGYGLLHIAIPPSQRTGRTTGSLQNTSSISQPPSQIRPSASKSVSTSSTSSIDWNSASQQIQQIRLTRPTDFARNAPPFHLMHHYHHVKSMGERIWSMWRRRNIIWSIRKAWNTVRIEGDAFFRFCGQLSRS